MLGFALPQFGASADEDLAEFARAAEQLGTASLWVAARLLTAVESEGGYAGGDPAAIGPAVRINVAPGSTTDDVADAVGRLADTGFTDVFVDLLYVARGIDERPDWVPRVLEKT